MTLVLTRSDVEELISLPDTIAAVRAAHVGLATGQAGVPVAPTMAEPGSDTVYVGMAAVSRTDRLATVKLLADMPSNAARGLPTQRSAILAVSSADGSCAALVDGAVVTRFRTAATSAVATEALARPGSRVLGLVGAGRLARAHVEALREVRPFDRVVVWSRTGRTARELADGTGAEVVESAEAVFDVADVVCTLTPTREPHVRGDWLRPGQHVNVVGAPPRADHREVDSEAIRRSRVVIDARATSWHDSGDIVIPLGEGAVTRDHVGDELGAVLAGQVRGRSDDEQITLFNSVGVGLQDLAVARLLIDEARRTGIGLEVDLSR
ncbi:ornithine cyclodeaminase [Nocardioides aromaticivorans]|uniref:Ornithine cyclodeaminase n=1 Tax=Nocardioides aromaticivorans TaxID=200618 RepID=A0ABX7PN77_9ACTN|nr:ornithine cyclodeaminase family protein [Nocardioides aromaticivorans]QSR27279.1 ornithine cyclodeaminase [Nocardioides aromaticivorans]